MTKADPYQITTKEQLEEVNDNLSAHYILMNDIDLQNTGPIIGTYIRPNDYSTWFLGTFDGNGYVISNYKYHGSEEYVGLFGAAEHATIKNLTIENVDIYTPNTGTAAGGLAGMVYNQTKIINCNVIGNGKIETKGRTGGLVGVLMYSSLQECSSDIDVVSTNAAAGGLVAWCGNGAKQSIEQCYATGNVIGKIDVGGLIGRALSEITCVKSYATGKVSGNDNSSLYIGGLIGQASYVVVIENCYALGDVSTGEYLGGLIGYCYPYSGDYPQYIRNCYSIGKVPNITNAGGILTKDDSNATFITSIFYNTTTSGFTPKNPEDVARTTEEMTRQITFSGWDFNNIWSIEEGETFPYLKNLPKPGGVIAYPNHVETVTLSHNNLVMYLGDTSQLNYTIIPSDASIQTVTWSSSDTSVATVDSNGLVTAVGDGIATITATAHNGVSDSCVVTVKDPNAIPVEAISLDQNYASIEQGDTLKLTETIEPFDATDKTVVWRSSDEGVIIVDSNGNVTAVGDGHAAIVAITVDGIYTDFCNITVGDSDPAIVPLENIAMDPTYLTIDEGETYQLDVIYTPVNATDKSVSWSSSDLSVATVNSNGVVTGISRGNAVIVAESNDGGYRAFCTVTVEEGVPQEPENLALKASASATSEHNATYGAGKANDGDLDTRWMAGANDLTVDFELEFDQDVTFNQLIIRELGFRIGDYEIAIWNGSDYVVVHSGNRIGPDYQIDLGSNYTTTKIKLSIYNRYNNNANAYSIYELEVYRDLF